MVTERIPSEGSERARGLGSEVGERLGELGGVETLRASMAHGVQGAYSVRACAVRSASARPPRASVECSDDRALASTVSASEGSSTHV